MGDEGGGALKTVRRLEVWEIQSHLPVRTILPVDIVREIQSQLPVKSLLRFTCVCKTWYKLIKEEDPLLKYSKKKERLTLINFNYCSWESSRKPAILTIWADPPAPTVRRVVNGSPFLLKPNSTKVTLRVLGPCNGLFCLYNNSYSDPKITLWNPTTREIKAVPNQSCIRKYHRGYKRADAQVGFGFDSRNNDYKVVKIWWLTDSRGKKPPKHSNEVEVYSLNTDAWRISKAVLPILVIAPLCCPAYLNGIQYWLYEDKILLFSTADEIFEMIPPPPEASADFSVGLAVWKHHLAFFNRSSSPGNIWILTEKEKEEKTWIRGDTIGPLMCPSSTSLVGIGFDDAIILEDRKGILFYNHRTQETTRLQTGEYHQYTGDVFFASVLSYTESLVSIKGEPEPAGMN